MLSGKPITSSTSSNLFNFESFNDLFSLESIIELFGFNDKSGTRWKFCLIPLGGYVKFFGDRNVFSQAEQQELLKRYSILFQTFTLREPTYFFVYIVAAIISVFVFLIFIFIKEVRKLYKNN